MKHLSLIAVCLPLLIVCSACVNAEKQSSDDAQTYSSEDSTGLDALPDGDYLFVSRRLIEAMPGNYQRVVMRKSGNTAVGAQLIYPDDNPCFKGTLMPNAIVNVQLARPFYQGQEWRYSMIDRIRLDGYTRAVERGDRTVLAQCANRF